MSIPRIARDGNKVSTLERQYGGKKMRKIRWIHFSDLHLGNDSAVDTQLMRMNLPAYIASLNRQFDYAFCSGDIKEWNADYTAAPGYIRSLVAAAKTPLDHLFIVPGNHDIEIGGDKRAELISQITDWKTDYYQSSNGMISQDDFRLLRSGEEAFLRFIEELLGKERSEKYNAPHFVISTEELNILHVDSTTTYGNGHDRDFVIGTRALMDALESCDRELPTVILTHYSFDFLTQSERNQVEKLLSTYGVHLWIAGHEHENLIRWQREKFVECQCGNLALQKGARSCFLTGELDLDTGDSVIMVHAWYEGKDWELYPFARTGSEDDRIFPFQLRWPGSSRPTDVSLELANAREAFDKLSAASGIFSGVQVNSYLLADLEMNCKVYHNEEEIRPLTGVIEKLWSDRQNHPEMSCNALILGDGGMGKSTMMFQECCELLAQRELAVYISLQAMEGSNMNSLFGHILRCLYKSEDDRAREKFIRLTSSSHAHPDLVLFIDGFNELSGEGAQKYVAEIKELSRYSGIQIIVSSRLNFLRDYGLSHFGMVQTCDLRENQIQKLFENRQKDWDNAFAQKNLRILLRNPMMALLYAHTCPIVERHADLDYLDWIVPITNASDLLHDFYMAQIAILVDRENVDGSRIFDCMVAVDCLLPALAYQAERNNSTVWRESEFDTLLGETVSAVNQERLGEHMPEKIKKIKRRLRVHKNSVVEDEIYDLIISEMVLLRSGNGVVSFAHQIFRDYLAAVYLHNCLIDNLPGHHLWHEEEIHRGVVQYLRFIGNEATWGADGTVSEMLLPYRNKETVDGDWFVANVLNCWLSIGDGERDLSSLDLRKVTLSENLRGRFNGTINIDGAWLSKETLINDRHHDAIIGISFSHDNHTMAAVSKNGIVSVTNILTQSQMIVGELGRSEQAQIGFDADDYLVVKMGQRTCRWSTIAYDKIEEGDAKSIITIPLHDEDTDGHVAQLKKRLKESGLEGIIEQVSENGRYLAVGFESGFIQVWDSTTQDCIANLSLSDSQIATVAFTKDGKFAALGSGGKMVQLWDMDHGISIGTLYFEHRVSELRFPANGDCLECQFSDGSYYQIDISTGEKHEAKHPMNKPFLSNGLLKKTNLMKCAEIQSSPNGNAIILTEKGTVYTWDERLKSLNECPGHMSKVTAIAICSADGRFAASYSPETYQADRDDRHRRRELNEQKLVRVRIVKTGQCQWRLPTMGRSISKLQFFTSNRIILAGYATNGDIMLWELINEQRHGKEIGHWESVEIVRNNQAEPLECAFPDNRKDFISAYADGTILIRPFETNSKERKITTIPGIDAGVFRWHDLKCSPELKQMLAGYQCLKRVSTL